MAFSGSPTVLTHGSSSGGTSSTTASISPSANKLILVFVRIRDTDNIPPSVTLAGCGLTWDEVTNVRWGDSNERRSVVFRSMGTPSTGVLTITHDDSTVASCAWAVIEIDGVPTTGSNGSDAVRQSAGNDGDSDTPSVTLAAFGSADHATFGFVNNSGGEAVAQGSGFTELLEGFGTTTGIQLEWRGSADTSVTWTLTDVSPWGAIALEVVGASFTASSATTLPRLTASASGSTQTAQSGTSAATLPALTAAADGLLQPSGTAADALPALTASASGYMQPDGTGTPTLPALTARATGAQTAAGELAGDGIALLPALTAAAVGGALSGSGTPSLPALTALAAGAHVLTGTAAGTLGGLSLAGSGDTVPLGGAFRISYHRGIRPARRQFR
jgi:hypothetical protein